MFGRLGWHLQVRCRSRTSSELSSLSCSWPPPEWYSPATDPSADGRVPSAIEAHEILPPGALAASPTIKTTTTSTLLTDGFEGSFPGATWQLYHDTAGADVDWGKSSHRKSAGSYSIWCAAGGSASPGPGGNVPVFTNTWVIAGPFDLSGATSGELKFDLWLVHRSRTTTTSSGWRRPTAPTSRGFRPRPTPAVSRP